MNKKMYWVELRDYFQQARWLWKTAGATLNDPHLLKLPLSVCKWLVPPTQIVSLACIVQFLLHGSVISSVQGFLYYVRLRVTTELSDIYWGLRDADSTNLTQHCNWCWRWSTHSWDCLVCTLTSNPSQWSKTLFCSWSIQNSPSGQTAFYDEVLAA